MIIIIGSRTRDTGRLQRKAPFRLDLIQGVRTHEQGTQMVSIA
jgi:hypothetical protein